MCIGRRIYLGLCNRSLLAINPYGIDYIAVTDEEINVPLHVTVELCLIDSSETRVHLVLDGVHHAILTMTVNVTLRRLGDLRQMIHGRDTRFSGCPFNDRRVFRDSQPLRKILRGVVLSRDAVLVLVWSFRRPPPGRQGVIPPLTNPK
jgi:hypothetical protein